VCAKLAEHYLAEQRNLPSRLKPCLPSSVEQTVLVVESKKVAPFLPELGGVGRAALRLQAPTLATCPPGPRPTGEPQCALCHQQPESPVHLLHHCSGVPADTRVERADLVKTRALENTRSGTPTRGRSSTASPRPRLRRGRPPSPGRGGRTVRATARLLWLAGRVVDYCSNQVAPVGPASPEGRPRRLVSASRVRPCRLPPCAARGSPKGVLFRVVRR
jgi:hypothetical protein